jgi:aryl carrier-like protein
VDKKFIDMGLDSVLGVEWIGEINKQYGTSIGATKFYEYLTIREFAGFLEKELNKPGGELHQALPRSTPSISLDEALHRVQERIFEIEEADNL